MDNYYEWLDVPPDADRDTIRDAYRSHRDELKGQDSEDARTESARLNRAWNVLSDPTQRERYDERLAALRAGDEDPDPDESDDPGAPATRAARSSANRAPATRAERRAEMRQKAANRRPQLVLPEGYIYAPNRNRLMALGFDALVLLLIYGAVFFGGWKIIENKYPGERSRYSDLSTQNTDVTKKVNAAKKDVTAAEKAVTEAAKVKHDTVAETTARNDLTKAKADQAAAQTDLDKVKAEQKKIQKDLQPATYLMQLAMLVFMLLYLVPSTAISGQTLGKKLRGLRVIKVDGTLPGFSTSLIRFGLPLMIALIFQPTFGPLAFGLVVAGMAGWLSNPNHQGLHDRLAKTAVVEA